MINIPDIGISIDLWEILATLIVIAWSIAKAWILKKNARLEKIISAFEVATNILYLEARNAKKQSPDNKIPTDKVDELRNKAMNMACSILAEQGIDLLRDMTPGQQRVLVDKVIQAIRNGVSIHPGKK